jgi:hypothetical protein
MTTASEAKAVFEARKKEFEDALDESRAAQLAFSAAENALDEATRAMHMASSDSAAKYRFKMESEKKMNAAEAELASARDSAPSNSAPSNQEAVLAAKKAARETLRVAKAAEDKVRLAEAEAKAVAARWKMRAESLAERMRAKANAEIEDAWDNVSELDDVAAEASRKASAAQGVVTEFAAKEHAKFSVPVVNYLAQPPVIQEIR